MFAMVFVVETIIRVSVIVSIVFFIRDWSYMGSTIECNLLRFLESLRMFYLFLLSNVIRRYCINYI